jgi:hypothetical protein
MLTNIQLLQFKIHLIKMIGKVGQLLQKDLDPKFKLLVTIFWLLTLTELNKLLLKKPVTLFY